MKNTHTITTQDIQRTLDLIDRQSLDSSSQSCSRTGHLALQALRLHLQELRGLYNEEDNQIESVIFEAINYLTFKS